MYYNSRQTVNNFRTAPRDVIYLVDQCDAICHPFRMADETEDAGWQHILLIGFEGLRADRIGDSIFITSQRGRSFIGGHA